MQILTTSTTIEKLLNLTNLFPVTSQHIQILTSPTTMAKFQNLMTCLPYISCHSMQVLTALTTLSESGNPIPHHVTSAQNENISTENELILLKVGCGKLAECKNILKRLMRQ
jgi:hypothetical protein